MSRVSSVLQYIWRQEMRAKRQENEVSVRALAWCRCCLEVIDNSVPHLPALF